MRGIPPGGSLLAAVAATLAACAHVEAPPGGAEDLDPPTVVVTRPEDDAVVPEWSDPVVFAFDERVSEQGVEESVIVSPRTSPVEVRHGGSEIRVSLRRGWVPGQIYQVTLLPDVRDLFGNALAAPATLTFSTGPAIPDTRLAGTVADRITGRADALTRVEAIRSADSLVYATRTDSAGLFVLEKIPEGEYLVRAFRDQNRNRSLDPFEQRDSVEQTLATGEPVAADLRVLAPDSTGPRIAGVAVADSALLTVRFDDYLDPAQALAPTQVEVVDSTGVAVPVARVAVGELPPRDSTGAVPPPAEPGPEDDTLPTQTLAVELEPGATVVTGAPYVLRVRAIRNVNGLTADDEREFDAAAPAGGVERVPPAPLPG